jgi:chromosome segregation ATPase
MIEPIMYIGIGFLVAGLLVIGVIPLVHARAVRLTMRRLEALTPLSRAEIQADKDQLRAEFAMSMSRLEMNVEQMKAKTTSQAAEIGRKSEAIGRLKFELGEKTAALFALEAKERQLADDVRALENELAARTGALQEAEGALANAQAELTRISAHFQQNALSSDTLQAQAALLQDHVGGYDKESKELRDRLSIKTAEAEAARQQLIGERGRADQLGARVGELERQLVAQTTEAEGLARRVQELGTQLEEQGRFLTDYENASDRLRTEAMSAQESESTLRAELAELEGRYRLAIDTVTTEKSLIESELKRSHDERAKLQRDIAAMRRDAENGGANVRKENAVLRESINDVAAEVARLTATLEGPDSPIAAILDGDVGRPAASGANGAPPARTPRTGESKDTLADRIRTLQGGASRAAPASEPARGPARNARR